MYTKHGMPCPAPALLAVFLTACAARLESAEPPPADAFALAVEAGKEPARVMVVGAWTVDGVQGWSWGLCHDPAEAVIAECPAGSAPFDPCDGRACAGIVCPADMAAPGPGGKRADFHSVSVSEGGVTQGVLLDFTASWTLDARDRFVMLEVAYDLVGPSSPLAFCDTLGGDRPVRTTFVADGQSIPPAVRTGLTIRRGTLFVRGNTNADDRLNIADAILALGYIFSGGESPPCLDAADANDDGRINVADAITILGHLFGETGPLPDPFTGCGTDPSEDDLTCDSFAPCGP
jgi:hypothetical protein